MMLRNRVYSASLLLVFLLIFVTILPGMIWTGRINTALVSVNQRLMGKYPTLQISELLVDNRRPIAEADESCLADLVRLSKAYPASRVYRALGIGFALLGHDREAESYLGFAGTDRLSLIVRAIVYTRRERLDDARRLLITLPGAETMLAINGHSAYWAGHYEDAKALLEMALTLDFGRDLERAPIYRELSLIYGLGGDLKTGIRYAQLWSGAAHDDADADMTLAAFYVQQGQAEEAYAVLQRSGLSTKQHALYGVVLARIYDLRGDLVKAISVYRNELQKNPTDPYLNWYLGSALYRSDEPKQALPFLEAALRSSVPALQQAAGALIEQIKQNESARP